MILVSIYQRIVNFLRRSLRHLVSVKTTDQNTTKNDLKKRPTNFVFISFVYVSDLNASQLTDGASYQHCVCVYVFVVVKCFLHHAKHLIQIAVVSYTQENIDFTFNRLQLNHDQCHHLS